MGKEMFFYAREGARHLYEVEIELPKVDMPLPDDEYVFVASKEGEIVSSRVMEFHSSSQAVVYFPRWMREVLDIEPEEQISARLIPYKTIPAAGAVTLALPSALLAVFDRNEIARDLKQTLVGRPIFAKETKKIPFHLDPQHPAIEVFIVSIDEPESEVVVITQASELSLQVKPSDRLLMEAQKLSEAIISEGTSAWQKQQHLLETLAEIAQITEDLTEANATLLKQVKELTSPILEHAVLISRSRQEDAMEDEYEIGFQGRRLTVTAAMELADILKLNQENLTEGREILLNERHNIVGVLAPDQRGVVVEVVNVIQMDKEGLLPNRLQVRFGGNDLVVDCGRSLMKTEIEIGDLVRIDPAIMLAFEKIQHHETGELQLEDVPRVTYDDIGGLEHEIDQIRDAIALPYLRPELFKQFNLERPKGLLLYGPPGCGKTMIAKALANDLTRQIEEHLKQRQRVLKVMKEVVGPGDTRGRHSIDKAGIESLNQTLAICLKIKQDAEVKKTIQKRLKSGGISTSAIRVWIEDELKTGQTVLEMGQVKSYFLNIKGPELLTKWVGDTELKIRKVFEMAKKRASFYTPVVLFFDEMEALFRKRGSGISSDIELTIVPQFLSEMDGVEEYSNVIVVGATNRHELLDPAVTRAGRLDIKVPIGRPSADQARKIFEKYFYPWSRADGQQHLPLDSQELKKYASPDEMIKVMIDEAVGVIYNQNNLVRVVTRKGKEFFHPLSEFVSGALIRSITSRASQKAIKRSIEDGTQAGISLAIFKGSLEEEFKMNKDHFLENLPELEEEEGFEVDLEFHTETEYNKWDEPRLMPYLAPARSMSEDE